jgi:hypothetical protein
VADLRVKSTLFDGSVNYSRALLPTLIAAEIFELITQRQNDDNNNNNSLNM